MDIQLHGPLASIAGKNIQIPLSKTITLRQLLNLLVVRHPGLTPYASCKTDIDLSAHLMVYKKDIPLKIDSKVENNDHLQFFIHIMGG